MHDAPPHPFPFSSSGAGAVPFTFRRAFGPMVPRDPWPRSYSRMASAQAAFGRSPVTPHDAQEVSRARSLGMCGPPVLDLPAVLDLPFAASAARQSFFAIFSFSFATMFGYPSLGLCIFLRNWS